MRIILEMVTFVSCKVTSLPLWLKSHNLIASDAAFTLEGFTQKVKDVIFQSLEDTTTSTFRLAVNYTLQM